MDLSPVQLVRLFKRSRLLTPSTFLKRAQVARAQLLLHFTSLSVDEIGRRAGFETRSTFYRCFRREVGCTPARHRLKEMRLDSEK